MPARRAQLPLALLLAAALALTLAACTGDSDEAPAPTATATSRPTATPTPTATTPPTPSPTSTPSPTATATPTPTATAAPTPTSTPSPSPIATPEPAGTATTFRYTTYDTTGAVAEPGSYAFLADPADSSSAVTTYEALRDGTARALRIHATDADGVSHAAFLDTIEVGDLFEWRYTDDCWTRYQVTGAPEPLPTASMRNFGIEWLGYAYAGCTGAIEVMGRRSLTWSPHVLGYADFTTAIRFGGFILYPMGWSGEYEDAQRTASLYGEPGEDRQGRILSSDLATARQHPLWREPALPDGWTLTDAETGTDGQYVYWAHYSPPGGGFGVTVAVGYLDYLPFSRYSSSIASERVKELRVIDGRPAIVEYSQVGVSAPSSTYVAIYEQSTGLLYEALGSAPSLKISGPALTIEIVRSLMRPPQTTFRYTTYDTSGAVAKSGSYAFLADPADISSAVTTYEGLRDGTARALRISATDADGVSRAAFLDTVAVGDLFEWRQAEDCFVRYTVTELLPEPSGTTRRLLGVEWMTYAFTGCSGPIAPEAVVTVDWAPPPVTSHPIAVPSRVATTPVRHGPWLLHPQGWAGEYERVYYHAPTAALLAGADARVVPLSTTDLAEARQLLFWRDPALPNGWTFATAEAGLLHSPVLGYCADYRNERGYRGAEICVYYAYERPMQTTVYFTNDGSVVKEARVIDGLPALVEYSPQGASHASSFRTEVWIFDPATGLVYNVEGIDANLRGDNIDGVVAIARSLFEPPSPP